MIWIYAVLLSFLNFSGDHDIHLSKTKIKYVPSKQSWQISTKIFIDDLEAAIQDRTNKELKLFTEKEDEQSDFLINEYINEKLVLLIDGNEVEAEWLGKEMSDDLAAAWCYLEILETPVSSTVGIDYNLFHDRFTDQNNVVIIELPDRKKDYFIFFAGRELETIEL